MPNIYLRMPSSRCLFFRHRNPNHTLAKDEPLVFSLYMPEYFVLKNGLVPASNDNQEVGTRCFSEQQWRNMMAGGAPNGGKKIHKRDKTDYLSFAEVQHLCGIQDYDKSAKEDYLCIRLPREVEFIDTVKVVTATWNLCRIAANQLIIMLNNDFKRSVVEWALSTFDFCTSGGKVVCRSQASMLERYMMRYGIEPNVYEKDNLRRIIERWLNHEHVNFKAYSMLDMQFEDEKERITHIDEFVWE